MATALAFALGLVLGAAAWRLRSRSRSTAPGWPALALGHVVDAVPPRGELREALDALTRVISLRLDDAPVVLRLFNARAGLYEVRAFAGLSEPIMAEVSNADVSRAQFDSWARDGVPQARGFCPAPESSLAAGDLTLARTHHPFLWMLPLSTAGSAPLGYLALALSTHLDAAARQAVTENLSALASSLALLVEREILRSELLAKHRECSLAAQELGDLQRLKENFVATVSHELRTPLTSIRAYAEMLSQRFDALTSAQAQDFCEVILRESVRLDEAFDTILDVAQPDARMQWHRERFDLRDVSAQLHRSLSAAYGDKSVELLLESCREPLILHGDRTAITQVLRNLLDNALKFTREGGRVHLRLAPDEGQARIVVEDTGIGIPPGERERIFERFYQVDGSSTRSYGGQGLGLAICRDIIEGHAGRIWAERAWDGGARFVVLLPERGLVLHPRHEVETDAAERLQRRRFFQLATGFVAETLRTRIVSIMRPDETGEGLRIEAALGLEPDVVRDTFVRAGEGVAGLVWTKGRSVLAPDLDADPRFRGRGNEVQYPTRSLLSCPLVHEGQVVGVINVNNKAAGDPFDEDDQIALEGVADRLAQALARFDAYTGDYQRLRDGQASLRAMLDVSRQRSTATRRQLIACGVETGRRLALPEHDLRTLGYALRHYDLGLAEVGSRILAKPGPLTASEQERVREHVHRGAELAAALEPSAGIRKILLHHHENLDGSGYPHGTQGEAIPVGARIVRLVDTFCALVDARPYRAPVPPEAAVEALRQGMGREYCPRVTPVFLSVLADRWEHIVGAEERAGSSGPAGAFETTEAPEPVGVWEDR